jgi:glycosyltransferase involved in cell wall biosynthesis
MKRFVEAILTRIVLVTIYAICLMLYAIFGVVGRRRRLKPDSDPRTLIVIGTFYTRNWCISHITPLTRSPNIRNVYAVVDGPVADIPNVIYVRPPRWMVRLFGRAFSKLITTMRLAVKYRPDLVMGYHLFPNALSALLAARLSGARSAYQVTGGANEIVGGGWRSENILVKRLSWPSPVLRVMVNALARRFDVVIVRGEQASRYFIEEIGARNVRIIPGSIRTERFCPNSHERQFDVVWVGRVAPIKQPEQMLSVLAEVKKRSGRLHAAVVGDGPLLESMRQQADDLGLSKDITFTGYVDDVERFVAHAKIFLLTSKTEGLSIAMAEAMAAGAVPVVPNVGDLGELVQSGKTGWLITPNQVPEYAERICELLLDPERLSRMSQAARQAAIDLNDVDSVARRWEALIAADRKPIRQEGGKS